ncbi:type IV pilus assembly protein PilE [Azomonas agilis]|uniref:Type IV pilus assembly protein PilE n=1 Tax=Azomonas agilis TaxID=116849 RepID=A0A562HZT3_9GAMM|nr:type IV pilin protein [Azomonas agilis]TWH64054.1 type IV pilus assembly protein PilE [Azomonas agilis]
MTKCLILQAKNGFTLLEMMVVVVLIGILAAIAYPNYIEYITHSNRTEGIALLSDAAARQERYFAQNSQYAINISSLGLSGTSASGYYTLTVTKDNDGDDGGYTLTATPQGSQATRDTVCRALTLDAKGVKGANGVKENEDGYNDRCWR